MSQALSLHLALFLVPYLAPADIACAQLVCKDWANVFSSDKLLLAALRIHFPFSHEVRSLQFSHSPAITFTRIARRYAALRTGIPQQELRFPISKTRRDIYVWAFAENLLVYQSRHHPHAILSLFYLDYNAVPPRIRNGTITLDAGGETVICIKVCRGVLIVERTVEHRINPGRTGFFAKAECYRLQFSGSDEVTAKKISEFDTFGFQYIDYSHQILSDHSGKYYAAYSKSVGASVGVWEIETGMQVKRIIPTKLEGIGGLMTDLLVVQEATGHKVVVIGNDRRNNNARRWDRFPSEWGYLSNICIFPIDGDGKETTGFVGRTKRNCPHDSNLLTTTFKVTRPLGDFDGNNTEETEEAALVLWELKDRTNKATAHYHTLSEAAFSQAGNANEPIRADVRYVLPSTQSTHQDQELGTLSQARNINEPIPADASYMPQNQEIGQRPTPFTVKTKDALSFTMDFTGRNEDFEDTRLMLYHLRIQSFYPSPTDPSVMNLAWESYLKQAEPLSVERNVRKRKENRGIYSANRNVTYQDYYGMEVVGDERAVVFLELRERGMDLVLVVWDDRFEGAVPEAKR